MTTTEHILTPDGPSPLERVYNAATKGERDRCLRVVEQWLKPAHVRLHAGEMSAQEMRSVLAVVSAIAAGVQRY